MFELLFLLLPIAAAYGWFMGKRDKTQKNQDRNDQIIRDYVNGLNFLLSNKKEEAIDLFLAQLKEEESHHFETHLTIGNLFRTRGEVERAIHIHRGLLESEQLTTEEKLLTQKELAQDYFSSGLYDRSEQILLLLADEEDFNLFALSQLIAIYQATLEWEKAIGCAIRLIKLGDKSYSMQVGQFYCELATVAINQAHLDRAKMFAVKAISFNAKCVRASLLLGKIAMKQKLYEIAKVHLMHPLDQNPIFAAEALPQLKICCDQLANESELKHFLEACVFKKVGDKAELMLVNIIEEQQGDDKAREELTRYLTIHPNLNGFLRLIDYHLMKAENGNAKESLILLKNMVQMQIKQLPNYRCEQCGFAVKTLYWLCPKCRNWESIKPIQQFSAQLTQSK